MHLFILSQRLDLCVAESEMLQFTMLLVGDHGAALSDIKKEGEGNEEWVNDSMYLTPSPVWVALRVLQLQPQFPLFSHFLSCFFFENRPKTAAVAWHFFPLSHTHDLCLPSTPPHLSLALSHAFRFFLFCFFCLHPLSVFHSMSGHARVIKVEEWWATLQLTGGRSYLGSRFNRRTLRQL